MDGCQGASPSCRGLIAPSLPAEPSLSQTGVAQIPDGIWPVGHPRGGAGGGWLLVTQLLLSSKAIAGSGETLSPRIPSLSMDEDLYLESGKIKNKNYILAPSPRYI